MPEYPISTAAMRIVQLLVGREPQTVAQLIEAAGVTRTAVIEQLNELVAAGYVERSTERLAGRGRPRHRYAATPQCLELLFAGNQRLLVPAIFQAIDEIGGRELRRKVLRRVSRLMAEHYKHRVKGSTPAERLVQLGHLLQQEGVLVDVRRSGDQVVLSKRSCPFISMYEETQSVCCIDQEMIGLVVGASIRQVACRHEGAPCCEFSLESTNGR